MKWKKVDNRDDASRIIGADEPRSNSRVIRRYVVREDAYVSVCGWYAQPSNVRVRYPSVGVSAQRKEEEEKRIVAMRIGAQFPVTCRRPKFRDTRIGVGNVVSDCYRFCYCARATSSRQKTSEHPWCGQWWHVNSSRASPGYITYRYIQQISDEELNARRRIKYFRVSNLWVFICDLISTVIAS